MAKNDQPSLAQAIRCAANPRLYDLVTLGSALGLLIQAGDAYRDRATAIARHMLSMGKIDQPASDNGKRRFIVRAIKLVEIETSRAIDAASNDEALRLMQKADQEGIGAIWDDQIILHDSASPTSYVSVPYGGEDAEILPAIELSEEDKGSRVIEGSPMATIEDVHDALGSLIHDIQDPRMAKAIDSARRALAGITGS